MTARFLVFVLVTGLFLLTLDVICQKLLQREFAYEYFRAIARANGLEFLAIRSSLEDLGFAGDGARIKRALKYDFVVLTYLLKNAAHFDRRYTLQDWVLMAYFHMGFASLAVRHRLKLRTESAIMELTGILKYFANVVGERVNTLRMMENTSHRFLSLRNTRELA